MGKSFVFGGRTKIKLNDTARNPRPNFRSTIPASTNKSVKAEGVRSWGSGLGNNVNNLGNGVNATERRLVAEVDSKLRAHRRDRKKHAKVKVVEFQSVAQEFLLTRLVATGDESALFPNLSPRTEKRIPVRSPAPPSLSVWGEMSMDRLARLRRK